MPIRFSFSSGGAFGFRNAAKANAEVLGRELLRLSKITAELKPKHVLDAAKDPKNPLHRHITWDDQVAADRYRRDEARSIIRCVDIRDDQLDVPAHRMFFSIADKGRAYRRLDEILDSRHLQTLLLEQAEKDLRNAEERVRELKDVCNMVRRARKRLSEHIKRTREEPKYAHV